MGLFCQATMGADKTDKEFSREEVKAHTNREDVWFVIHNKVYDITKFLDDHPGGEEVMLDKGGQDATHDFEDLHHSQEARKQMEEFMVGKIREEDIIEDTAGGGGGGGGGGGMGVNLVLALAVLGGAVAYYFMTQQP